MKLPVIGPRYLSALVALFIVVMLNGTFWTQIHNLIRPRSAYEWLFFGSFFVFQIATYLLFLNLLTAPILLRVVSAILVVVAAAASHFMGEYGMVIDVNMIRNVIQTDPAEARDLTTIASILRILGFGVLPAVIILLVPIKWPSWRKLLTGNLKAAAAALAVVAATFGIFSGAYFSVMREHREVVLTMTPANVVIASTKLGLRSLRHYSGPVARIGEDAHLAPRRDGERPRVTILVVGETARAPNFSLFGYGRKTTPELENTPELIAFPHTSSCGTDTAISVPCIFSGLGRAKYSLQAFLRNENLLDLVQRTGLGVTWIENQGGCKGVCARIPTETLTNRTDPRFCASGECHDEILLDGLEERIASMRNGGVIVLHMMGSHGPAYYKRVPKEFVKFTPICETSQFSKCTVEQVVNTYDNTIAYTDYVLAKLIKLLDKSSSASGVDTMMLYASDHGESLGENGIYLHAMPYVLAPIFQKHVPMVMWFSQNARESLDLDKGCMTDRAAKGEYSHDNIFHTVLGLQGVQTSLYKADLDIVQPCRRNHAT